MARLTAAKRKKMAKIFFNRAADEWISDTAWHSSISTITRHPRFAEIVGQGPMAAKLILERMVAGDFHVHWFPALKDILQTDPVPEDKRGRTRDMAAIWIEWGKVNGYVPH